MSLRKTTQEKNRYEQLIQLSEILAEAIDDCDSKRDLAALSRQYRDTVKELAEMGKDHEDIDEIAQIIEKRKNKG